MSKQTAPDQQASAAFLRRLLFGTCAVFSAGQVLYFLLYLILLVLTAEKPASFRSVLGGGLSVRGFLILLLIGLAASAVYALIRRKVPLSRPALLPRLLLESCAWYTVCSMILLILYGFYLDLIYNPNAVTGAPLLRGPSFLLCGGCLGISLLLPLVNRIYRTGMLMVFRFVLHLASVLLLVYVFLQWIPNGFSSSSAFLIFAVLFSLLYALGFLLWQLFRSSKREDEKEEDPYTSLFSEPEQSSKRR